MATLKRRDHGISENDQVAPPGAMRHILQIRLEPRAGQEMTKPFSQDQQARAAQSWPHGEYCLPVRILEINLIGLCWPGADQAQITADDIPERGDLVEREIDDETAQASDPRRPSGGCADPVVKERTTVSTNADCLTQRNLAKSDEQRESDENAER